VARPRKQTKIEIDDTPVKTSFAFFKQEVEDADGIRAMTAGEVGDPDPNRSGSYNLDYDLAVPFPEGRITEVFGEEGTCKTTLTLEVAGRALQAGKTVLYVNMEKNLNLSLMRTVRTLRPYIDDAIEQMENGVGGNCPLWIVNASNGEQAFEAMRKFASMVPQGIAILDSIDAAQPSAVLSGEIGEAKVGNLAKLLSDAMRKLIGVAEQNKVALVFVNQIRDKITMYGDPTDTPGGRALKFYASQRIRLYKPRKQDMILDTEKERIGVVIRYKVIKNKVAPDGNEGAFPILFRNGIFREQELVTQACNFGILRMGGKGGKQVYLPKFDHDKNDYAVDKDGEKITTCMSQFNAARKLLMDSALVSRLDKHIQDILVPGGHDPIFDLIDSEDEIQNT
jgi:recombination protein RecA